MKKTLTSIIFGALLLAQAGCARGFDINTPTSFAELDGSGDYEYRATSAEGVVIGVRTAENDPKGNLEFWKAAMGYELARRGYSKQGESEVKSASGTSGVQLRYSTKHQGRPHVFWATLFVTESKIVVVEAGGDVEHFEKVQAQVSSAINGIDV
ncbi:MAG TPA: serine/threonine protein kinase [Polyangiaceae bacterium]|nr:serine/threonine protein kinase [Polyangiaceae bacterium]HMR73770.1 serine/threonine protein kinase [Polyangiaceae bacterium]